MRSGCGQGLSPVPAALRGPGAELLLRGTSWPGLSTAAGAGATRGWPGVCPSPWAVRGELQELAKQHQ